MSKTLNKMINVKSNFDELYNNEGLLGFTSSIQINTKVFMKEFKDSNFKIEYRNDLDTPLKVKANYKGNKFVALLSVKEIAEYKEYLPPETLKDIKKEILPF